MKKLFYSLTVLCVTSLGTVSAQQVTAPSPTIPAVPAKDSLDFKLDVPEGWANQKDIQGVDVMFLAPPSKTGGSQANVNVISGDLDPGMTLDTFFTLNLNGLPAELSSFKQEDTGSTTINGFDTKWVRYTHKVGDLEIRVLQYFFVKDNKGYVVTLSALGSAYDNYSSTFDKTIKTFSLNK